MARAIPGGPCGDESGTGPAGESSLRDLRGRLSSPLLGGQSGAGQVSGAGDLEGEPFAELELGGILPSEARDSAVFRLKPSPFTKTPRGRVFRSGASQSSRSKACQPSKLGGQSGRTARIMPDYDLRVSRQFSVERRRPPVLALNPERNTMAPCRLYLLGAGFHGGFHAATEIPYQVCALALFQLLFEKKSIGLRHRPAVRVDRSLNQIFSPRRAHGTLLSFTS